MAATPPFKHLDCFVGRESEVQLIRSAYERVSKSPRSCEAVLVHGESGSGKTALVQHALQNERIDGTMVCGKFEVNGTQRPYSAIADALTQLCSSATWSNISSEDQFTANLYSQLSYSDLYILSRIDPSVDLRLASLGAWSTESDDDENEDDSDSEALTEQQPSHDNAFAFARFAEVVRTFVYLVARFLQSPLVLFLDDVQAADSESLSLMASLTSQHTKCCNLLLIVAYRDTIDGQQTSTPTTVLSPTTDWRSTDIQVRNLDSDQVNKIISRMLRMEEEETIELSQVITQRTGGNFYGSVQFAEMLKSKKLLGYSYESCRWEWNLDKIRSDTNVADNVALLLTSKIRQLSPHVQLALQLAACLGFYFEIELLERITLRETRFKEEGSTAQPIDESSSSGKFSDAISVAVEENLIDQAEGKRFKFTHDWVLQAAYEMIPASGEKDMLHWRIGQVLWDELQQQHFEQQHPEQPQFPKASSDWLLFTTADLLTRGSTGNLKEHESITQLNLTKLLLIAGKTALERSAFHHAARFFDRGVQALGSRWHSDYSLALELHTLSAETEYASSNFQNCELRVSQILLNARCLVDKLRAYLVKVQSQGVQGNVKKALEESALVLRIVGERIPRHPNVFHLLIELGKTKRSLKGMQIADLVELPIMTDPLQAWTVMFLKNVAIFSWYAGESECLLIAVCRMMQITVKHGVCAQGPFVLATYGLALGSLGDFDAAYEFGRAALELAKKPHAKSSYASAAAVVNSFLNHLKQPMIRSLDVFLEGYNTALKSGDIEGAALCLSGYATMGIHLGKRLDVVVAETEGFRQTYRDEFNRNFALMFLVPWHLAPTRSQSHRRSRDSRGRGL